jgi:hypothetical protein
LLPPIFRAHVAELADAYGSGPYGATRGGSSPLVSIADPSQMFAFEASNARAISLHPYYSLLLDVGSWVKYLQLGS